MDNFKVMPYLVGEGGTGKGVLVSVAQAFFAPGIVACLAPKRSDKFGMESLWGKLLVVGRDMPAALSGVLCQEEMQSMTSGEDMEVQKKGQNAVHIVWTTPVVMCSNWLPDYINQGNNVGRRLVTLRFENVISNPQEDLQALILATELPSILCRGLRAYAELRDKAKVVGGFWKAVPVKMLEWQRMLAAATNKLHEFLDMDDDDRGYSVEQMEGRSVALKDLKAAYERRMGGKFVVDASTLLKFGFRLSNKVNACKSCGQLAVSSVGGKTACCSEYGQGNRIKTVLVFGMVLEELK